MRRIKILRIINRFNIGGPTYNATFLTAFLDKKRYETLLIGGLPDVGESDSLYITNKYGVKPQLIKELLRKPSLKSDRIAYKKIKEIINDYQPDIVHTHASKAGALGRIAAKQLNVPITVHTFHGHVFHSYFGPFKTRVYKTIERYLAKNTSKIIAISNGQKRELAEEHRICEADKIESDIRINTEKLEDDRENHLDDFAIRLTELEQKAGEDLNSEVAQNRLVFDPAIGDFVNGGS